MIIRSIARELQHYGASIFISETSLLYRIDRTRYLHQLVILSILIFPCAIVYVTSGAPWIMPFCIVCELNK